MAGYDPNQPRDNEGQWTDTGVRSAYKEASIKDMRRILEEKNISTSHIGTNRSLLEQRTMLKKLMEENELEVPFIQNIDKVEEAAKEAAGIEPYDRSFIENNLFADDIEKNKDGTFTVRRTFYYKMGGDEYQWRDKVMESLPMAEIVGFGEIEKPFKGGALPKNQSHWWAKIRFPGK